MYSYIKGIITIIEPSYIVVENNGIGYLVFVANPYQYKLNEEYVVYLYQQIREDENTLYGFKSLEDKDLFLKLISVKESIYEAIETGNIGYLKKFPKIGDKVARQIILDLKGKLAAQDKNDSADYTELTETLKSLGYKPVDIKKVLPNIDVSKKLEEQIKDALKLLLK